MDPMHERATHPPDPLATAASPAVPSAALPAAATPTTTTTANTTKLAPCNPTASASIAQASTTPIATAATVAATAATAARAAAAHTADGKDRAVTIVVTVAAALSAPITAPVATRAATFATPDASVAPIAATATSVVPSKPISSHTTRSKRHPSSHRCPSSNVARDPYSTTSAPPHPHCGLLCILCSDGRWRCGHF